MFLKQWASNIKRRVHGEMGDGGGGDGGGVIRDPSIE